MILGLDIATSCGWALLKDGERIASGTWNLSPPKDQPGHRFALFRRELVGRCAQLLPDVIGYEYTPGLKGHAQLAVYGLCAVLLGFAHEHQIPVRNFRPQDLKQVAVGSDHADKAEMIEWAVRHFRFRDITGDDEADALACALATYQEIG